MGDADVDFEGRRDIGFFDGFDVGAAVGNRESKGEVVCLIVGVGDGWRLGWTVLVTRLKSFVADGIREGLDDGALVEGVFVGLVEGIAVVVSIDGVADDIAIGLLDNVFTVGVPLGDEVKIAVGFGVGFFDITAVGTAVGIPELIGEVVIGVIDVIPVGWLLVLDI